MKKSKRILTALACAALAALLLLGLFAGCAAKRDAQPEPEMAYGGYDYSASANSSSTMESGWGNVYAANMAGAAKDRPPMNDDSGAGESDGRFVITTANFTIQTKTYDAFAAALKADLRTMGGYTNSFDEWNYESGRHASVVARVPSKQLEAFLENLRKNGTVVNESQRNADVTDEMIETGSRKEALKNEEIALLAILEKAKNVEEIIIVQDRLSNVRAELQAYSQKLQSLQNQVAYSTVRIDVSEVNRITVPTQKFRALASSGFLGSLREIGDGLRNFALWFISAIPYLVMLAIPTVVLVWLIKRVRRNRKAKKAGMQA